METSLTELTTGKILVVDDNPENILLLVAILKQTGFEILSASDGLSAIEMAYSESPDLILLDIMMPEISGFEVCEILKKNERTKDIPVIFISALTELLDKVKAFSLGGVDYITKPFEPLEVKVRIETHLRLTNLMKRLDVKNRELVREITERKRVTRVLETSLSLFKSAPSFSADDIIQKGLDSAIRLSGSEIGFFHFFSGTKFKIREDIWSFKTEKKCTLPREKSHYITNRNGIWNKCSRLKYPVIYNNYPSFSEKTGLPEGHIPIERIMIIPMLENEETMALLGVGNKSEDYDTMDISQVSLLAENIWIMFRGKQMENELIGARKSAESANQAKSDFLAGMSHELRTPLNAIIGFSRILEKDSGMDPERKEKINIIINNAEHQLHMINDILNLSKIEAGIVTIENKRFSIDRLLSDIEMMMKLRAERKQLELLVHRNPEIPPVLVSDERKIRQVLINLVGNAIKFTSRGRIALRVSFLEEMKEKDRVRIGFEVEDTGIGIRQEELETVFKPFVQVNTEKAEGEGSGLGLAISRELVRALGGDISIQSQWGRGSVFSFDIPMKTAETCPEDSKAGKRIVGIEPSNRQFRVLVADDVSSSRLLLKSMLTPLGFRVFEAPDGMEAERLHSLHHPHLVFMDLRMPVRDGYSALENIRKTDPGLPVIAFSGVVSEEERKKALSAGFNDFIAKPVPEEDVYECLKKYLGVRFLEESISKPKEKEDEKIRQTSNPPGDIPEHMIQDLKRAVRELDTGTIIKTVDAISGLNPDLGKILMEKAQTFRYDKLVEIIKNISKKGSFE